MIRIAITTGAFDAIASTLPLGSVGYENKTNERGERLVWLDLAMVNRLRPGHARTGRVVQRCDFAAGVGKRRLRDSARPRTVKNLRIRVPPIGREPRQPDFGDQSKARERCRISISVHVCRQYERAGRTEPPLSLAFRIGENTRRN
jgi:hypothetical protein